MNDQSAPKIKSVINDFDKLLSGLIEQTYDAIFTWTFSEGIINWNSNAERLYGYKSTEVLGCQSYHLLKTEYPISFEAYISELKNQGRWEGELQKSTKDGKKIFVESRQVLSNVEDGTLIILETSRDITKRKLTDERILQQASLINKTQDAILVCDLNHRIILWNKGAERIYGWKSEQVLGGEISQVINENGNSIIEKALESLKQQDEWQGEAVQFTKDGKKIIVVSRWTLVRNEQNQPDYFLVINTDVTNLKHAEEQLFRTQRMESIGTLAGGIAHDLNNVLSPILMSVEMLQDGEVAVKNGEPWLSIIRENTKRGANLIKQVLTFARGGIEGERINVQIHHLIKDLIQVLNETLPKTIGIKFNLPADLAVISADPTQIQQVMMNLVVNAGDAMPDGGTLTLTAQNILLDKHFAQTNLEASAGKYVLLTVEDTGTGISAEIIERIYDPFFTTKKIGKGTGLGLSTSLSIIKSHGGFVNVESNINQGTKFSVYLPANETENTVKADVKNKPFLSGNGEFILVVDDDKSIRQTVTAMLEKYNYQVLTASDGVDALAIYAQNTEKISVVLTDMAMPIMDGKTTIRALRKLNPDLKIIAASGLTLEQSPEINANTFLNKPFKAETLLNTIANLLSDKNQ